MVLAGLALALSRLIDNSVVVLENIFRHMEMGESPLEASEKGGKEVELAVLAATCATSIVFFPVILLAGVSKYIFTAMALAVVFALFASFIVAMTVVPLFCAKFIRIDPSHIHHGPEAVEADLAEAEKTLSKASLFRRVVDRFNHQYQRLERSYDRGVELCLEYPVTTVVATAAFLVIGLAFYPLMGKSFFPRTDPGQFVVDVKAPPGTRLEVTDEYVAMMENDIRQVVSKHDMNMIVSNIGITPDLSAIYTSNSGMNTGFIQVSLQEDHKTSSFVYMQRLRRKFATDFPEVGTYFQTGGLVDSVINQGKPAPIDIRVGSSDMASGYAYAQKIAERLRTLPSVSDVLIPQDLDYPGLELNIDRVHAALLGISPQLAIDNVITALTSDTMIAPSFWVDPKTGNNYFLSVQYPDNQIKSLTDFEQIPLRAPGAANTTPLESLASIKQIDTPTEVDHYQLRRSFDVYVMPKAEDLGHVSRDVNRVLAGMKKPSNLTVDVGGSITDMHDSFKSFGIGFILAVVLIYLILMAQFASFSDPFIILLAVPPGVAGVILFLLVTGTTMNVMSLMGVIMMAGIAVSNSILIVEFVGSLRARGVSIRKAIVDACSMRLRPILMTSLATVLGIIPMALALEPGSEQYASLARAILGGLIASVIFTIYLVPAVYLLMHRKEADAEAAAEVAHV
jgi:multidrug efflux pump subunit AcrB